MSAMSTKMFRFSRGLLSSAVRQMCRAPFHPHDLGFRPDIPSHTRVLPLTAMLSNTVSMAMGPTGHGDALKQLCGNQQITHSRITVAKDVGLRDKSLIMGTKLLGGEDIKKCLSRGMTTRAAILPHFITEEECMEVQKKPEPAVFRRGVMMAVDSTDQDLLKLIHPVSTTGETTEATTPRSHTDTGTENPVRGREKKDDTKCAVRVKDGKTVVDGDLKLIEGMNIEGIYISRYPKHGSKDVRTEFKDALFLLSDKKITKMWTIMPGLELANSKRKPLVLIAEDIDGDALNTLIGSRMKIDGLQIELDKDPMFCEQSDILHDPDIVTRARAKIKKMHIPNLRQIGEMTILYDNMLMFISIL